MKHFYILFFFLVVGFKIYGQKQLTSVCPSADGIEFNRNVIFKWNGFVESKPTGTYQLTISSDSLLNNIIYFNNGLVSTKDSVVFSNGGVYYWKAGYVENSLLLADLPAQKLNVVDIYSIPNLSLFFSSDTGVVFDSSGRISRWTNLADTSNNALQSAVAQQPNFIDSVLELKYNSVIRLDGVDDLLQINNASNLANIYVVSNWRGGPNFSFFNGLLTGQSAFTILAANGSSTNLAGTSLYPTLTINGKSSLDFSPMAEYKLINAKRISGFSFANLNIGRDRTFTNRYWNGDIAEVMAFSTPINDSLKRIVEFYLCSKYSQPLSLGEDIINTISLCDTTYRADTSYSSYLWSNGDTLPTTTFSINSSYSLTVTNEFGCEFQDQIRYESKFFTPKDLVLCPGDNFIWDTKQNKSLFSFLWNDSSTDSLIVISSPGEYYFEVTDSNNCTYFSDTLKISYDSTLSNTSLGLDKAVCRGESISFERFDSSIDSYLWSTLDTTAFVEIDTAGIYTVLFSNTTCSASDTINISIKGDAPVANFLFDDLCFNDSTSFADNSLPATTSDTIVNWSWKFGNGDSSLLQNPKYIYSQRSVYRVLLGIETDKGCFDTISKVLEIEPLPQANFGFQNNVRCSKSRIFHEDSSSISRGSISTYAWSFGDPNSSQNTSQLRNPFHTYDTLGNYNVELKVISDQGCLDSVSKSLFINPTPSVDFGISGNCIADSIQFYDSTIIPFATIRDYRWTVLKIGAGSSLTDQRQNPLFKINSAGDYIVTFRVRTEVTTSESCESIKRDTIQLFDSPIAGFTVPVVCEEDSFQIVSDVLSSDSIIDYLYVFNQTDTFRSGMPKFSGQQKGNYKLELFVESDKKCTDSTSEFITINKKPNTDFDILNNNTGIPFLIDIRNNTVNAASYFWNFGNGDSSTAVVPNYIYSDTGTYRLNLIATSDVGCIDSVSENINALSRFIDAELLKIFLNENNLGDIEVSAQINNSGFNTINEIVMVVDLNNEFEFRETFVRKIYSGRSDGFIFGSTFIPDAGKKIDFVCVRILSVNSAQDSIETNNEYCELGFNNEFTLKNFPNPVEEFMNLEYTLPNDGEVDFKIFDALGRIRSNGFSLNQDEGYYLVPIDCSSFERGIYFYRFNFNGDEKIEKFMVK